MGTPNSAPTPIRQLVLVLLLIPIVSALCASLLTPWIPYSWNQIFRRMATIVAAGVVVWLLRRNRRTHLRWLGLEPTGSWRRELLIGGGVAATAYVTLLALEIVSQNARLTWMPSRHWWWAVGYMAPTAVLIGCLEECFFRGWLFQTLRTAWGLAGAALASSALYAALHLLKDVAQLGSKWPDFIGLLLLGFLCVYVRVVTGRLFVSIGLHSALVYVTKLDQAWLLFLHREPHWLYGVPRLLINGLWGWLALGVAFLVAWWRLQGGLQMVGRQRVQQSVIMTSLLVALAWGGTTVASADEVASPSHDPSRYHGMARKLGRGVANVGTGVLEIPRQMMHTTQQDGTIAGLTVGLVKGVGWAVSRELVGVYEVVTFVMPQPNDYGVILEPEFVYSHQEWQ